MLKCKQHSLILENWWNTVGAIHRKKMSMFRCTVHHRPPQRFPSGVLGKASRMVLMGTPHSESGSDPNLLVILWAATSLSAEQRSGDGALGSDATRWASAGRVIQKVPNMAITITITDMFTDNAHWLWMRVSKLWPPDMKGPWSQIRLFTNSEFLLSDSAGKILWKHHENPPAQTRLLCCWILRPGISLLSAGEFTGDQKGSGPWLWPSMMWGDFMHASMHFHQQHLAVQAKLPS